MVAGLERGGACLHSRAWRRRAARPEPETTRAPPATPHPPQPGTFGRVLECWDRKTRGYVAIKIVRAVQKYRDAAMIELEVLATLEANDPASRFHCVSLREWFDYRGHVCMVFERLGPSLYDFLRKNAYRPFPADLVRAFGRQLLEATAYMHSLALVHTDLKPENVLLASGDYDRPPPDGPRAPARVPKRSEVRVIDFGSATFDDAHHSAVVSTRHYRAPEVILGLGWSYPADLWSAGCILVELATGDALFQTHENLEHLAMMEAVLGPVPPPLASGATGAAAKLFDAAGRLDWPAGASSRRSVRAVAKVSRLPAQLAALADASLAPHAANLADLVSRMLTYDAASRITAAEALAHPFFADPLAREPPTPTAGVESVADDDGDEGALVGAGSASARAERHGSTGGG